MPRIRAATIDEHKALTRRSLLDAARRLIGEAGTAEIPLGEVALAAGVGRTTFYDYFSDRDDVIASLVEEELPRVLSDLIGSVDLGLASAERLAALTTVAVEFVVTDPVFGVILHRELGRLGPEAQQRIRKAHARLSGEMTEVYLAGVEEGVFRSMPPALAGRLIQDTIMSGAHAIISKSAPSDQVGVVIREFLLGGLGVVPLTIQ